MPPRSTASCQDWWRLPESLTVNRSEGVAEALRDSAADQLEEAELMVIVALLGRKDKKVGLNLVRVGVIGGGGVVAGEEAAEGPAVVVFGAAAIRIEDVTLVKNGRRDFVDQELIHGNVFVIRSASRWRCPM